jgi:hypothetical protein
MAAILEGLVKAGQATEQPVRITTRQIEQQFGKATTEYPRGNDKPREASAGGEVSGDISDEDTEEVYIDASLLDQHVRELTQSAGGSYDFKRAVENGQGRMVKIEDDLMDAMLRLEQAAPLLHRAMALAAQRERRMRKVTVSPLAQLLGKAGGSASGSVSGSESGSVSGDASSSASGSKSGEMSKFMAGDQDAGLRLMGRR